MALSFPLSAASHLNFPLSLSFSLSLPLLPTPDWMAPELFFGRTYNETIDVFSFSIILVSMILRIDPDPDEIRTAKFGLDMEKFATRGTGVGCPEELMAVTMRCADLNPAQRPSFEDVEAELYLLDLKLSSTAANGAQYGRWRRTSRNSRPSGGMIEGDVPTEAAATAAAAGAAAKRKGKKQRKLVPAIAEVSEAGSPTKEDAAALSPAALARISGATESSSLSESTEAASAKAAAAAQELVMPSQATLAAARAGPPSEPAHIKTTTFTPQKSPPARGHTPKSAKKRDGSGRMLQEDLV